MNDKQFELIKELTELQATSGNEEAVRLYLKDKIEKHLDQVEISPLGNIFGIKKSKVENAPKVMIAAHMDEVGFMVKRITAKGMIEVVPIGGWNPLTISSQRFTLQTHQGDYPIISSSVAPHLTRGGSEPKIPKASDILFDAGFESAEEAMEYGVRPGDSIVPQVEAILTANKKNVIAKAWDNRFGCAAIIELLERIEGVDLPCDLIIGASVQEEVGLRGIKGAVHTYQPDLFIAVDCSPADDIEENSTPNGFLGGGFLLRTQDPGMITHKGLWEYILGTAVTQQIDYQYFFSKGGTDAGAAHTMNQGIPSAVIGVPARYIHSHQTLFRLSDYHAALDVLEAMVKNLDGTAVLKIKSH